MLERDILLKNLKSVLESLRGRVTGKTKDEIEESISMVGFFIFFWQFIGFTFPLDIYIYIFNIMSCKCIIHFLKNCTPPSLV